MLKLRRSPSLLIFCLGREGRTCIIFPEMLILNIFQFFRHFLNLILELKPLFNFFLDLLFILILNHLLFFVQILFLDLKLPLELGLKLHVVLVLYLLHLFLFAEDLQTLLLDLFLQALFLTGYRLLVEHLAA